MVGTLVMTKSSVLFPFQIASPRRQNPKGTSLNGKFKQLKFLSKRPVLFNLSWSILIHPDLSTNHKSFLIDVIGLPQTPQSNLVSGVGRPGRRRTKSSLPPCRASDLRGRSMPHKRPTAGIFAGQRRIPLTAQPVPREGWVCPVARRLPTGRPYSK